MHYKVNLEINWTSPLGYVIVDEDERNATIEAAKKLGSDTISLSYCADGHNTYADFELSGDEIAKMFNDAIEIPDEDYAVIQKYGFDSSNGPADDVYESIDNELAYYLESDEDNEEN